VHLNQDGLLIVCSTLFKALKLDGDFHQNPLFLSASNDSKNPVIRGQATAAPSGAIVISGVPPPSVTERRMHLRIDFLNPTCTRDVVQRFIGEGVLGINELSPRRHGTLSFHVIIAEETHKRIFVPSFWPENVTVRRFFPRYH
jgi:hypothetical protein